jgi:tetratricopeptide (TPR) repeat protein
MMATFYSLTPGAVKFRLATAIFIFSLVTGLFADDARNKIFAARAEADFQNALIHFQSDTNNVTNAWQFARTCFDLSDFTTNDTQRAAVAGQGIAASRQAIARQPKSAAGHYYLALNLGELARTELLGALKLVKEMEHEFKTAAELDAAFDYAGPERNLGQLYRDAPGWPTSIGSKRKARSLLEQAAKLAPDYPENRLVLVESRLLWKEFDDARRDLKLLDTLWPKAQTNFTGVTWESSWADWAARRNAAHKQLDEAAASAKSAKNSH